MKNNEELAIENITKLKVQVCEYLLKKGEDKMLLTSQHSYTGNELIVEISQNTEVGTDFINRLILLGLDLFSRQKQDLPPPQTVPTEVIIITDEMSNTGGINQYFKDLEKWENSLYCNECGRDTHTTDFHYSRSVANGDVFICKCKNEIVVDHKPNEDNY
jgi:hypothetical protein